jgi:lipoprotein-releasing system ATP-binding protein
MIICKDIHKRFGDVEVLRGVSLEVKRGEIVAITGASGAGKSTLLHIMGTLLPMDSGTVVINGVDTASLGDEQLSHFRNRHIGFVFQAYHLLPEFTALENVMMPALIGGMARKEAEQRARELMELVRMEHRMTHRPAEMSGGEQQRTAIARALINRPSLLLADEPTGNLDTHTRDEIEQLLADVRQRFDQTIILVSHDEKVAAMADRKIIISDGAIL